MQKARFWEAACRRTLNERQREMLNRLLDGFEGKLTSSKWAKLAKCSQDTALRDIHDLVERGILAQGRGRRTQHQLSVERGLRRAARLAPLHPTVAFA